MAKRKNITTTQLALMTAAAVISLRGLPMMAQEELTMFFYIFFATFLFLIPAALVGAELGSAFASKGGGGGADDCASAKAKSVTLTYGFCASVRLTICPGCAATS